LLHYLIFISIFFCLFIAGAWTCFGPYLALLAIWPIILLIFDEKIFLFDHKRWPYLALLAINWPIILLIFDEKIFLFDHKRDKIRVLFFVIPSYIYRLAQ